MYNNKQIAFIIASFPRFYCSVFAVPLLRSGKKPYAALCQPPMTIMYCIIYAKIIKYKSNELNIQ